MTGEILEYHPTSKMAEAVRRMAKWGLNVADCVPGPDGTSPYREDTRFGFGGAETVASWIPSKFANLSEAQTAYPIIQGTDDTIDWVLLQTSANEAIYGALGNDNRGNTVREWRIPSGDYTCNRPIHLGYVRAGTPPANLNGNGYISTTLRGEGAQVDASGNGMPGVTIRFTCPWGILIHGYQRVHVTGVAVVGPYLNYYANNLPIGNAQVWNRDVWKPTGISDDNWLGGAAVSIGIGMDVYTTDASAAAMPPRPLPAAFGGGTTTAKFGTVGGTRVICAPDVIISGFVIGYGRPHGDSNGEFFEFNGDVTMCAHPFVFGHSQGRNHSITNTNCFGFHTMLGSRGGLTGNANLHGSYNNIHAGYGYQIVDHPNADWSGPLTLRDPYLEGAFRIGVWHGQLKLDGAYLSFFEQDPSFGIPCNHFEGTELVLDNARVVGMRHGLVVQSLPNNGGGRIVVGNGSIVYGGSSPNFASHTNAVEIAKGLEYVNSILSMPGLSNRVIRDCNGISEFGRAGGTGGSLYSSEMTYLDQVWRIYDPQTPIGAYNGVDGSDEMQGTVQQFAVPKITRWQKTITYAGSARSGFDIVVQRASIGDIKIDVSDLLCVKPVRGGDATLQKETWFIVVSVSGSNATIRQLNNYDSASQYDYAANGYEQIDPLEAGSDLYEYICTRIRSHATFWVGDVASGSNKITNIRNGFKYGGSDSFASGNMRMVVGDFHLHQETQRAGLKAHNKVTDINYTTNEITLTDNFNIDQVGYPLAFYVDVHNA